MAATASRNAASPRTPMGRAPVPALGHELIPKERYTSPDYARREWERMWQRVWLLAGRESDIPKPGDYLTFEIGTESVLVIRQRDGSIRARHNVCMHRGNRLREPGIGHAELFSCLFHGWQYEIDGGLRQALDPQSFPQGLPRERLDLAPVLCDTWGGFVWINLDPAAASLREYLGIIPEHLDAYHFEEWAILNDVTVEVDANWKACVDAFNEAYHVAATHPQTLGYTDDVNVPIDCYERHTRMLFREAVASPRHKDWGKVNREILELFLRPAGVDIARFEGGADDARAAMALAIRKQGPQLGCDFGDLDDSQLVDDFHYTIFPNITLNIHSRFTWVFRHRPHPDDPNKMFFDFFNLVRAPSHRIPRPQHEHHRLVDGYSFASVPGGEVFDQDMYNLPRIQAGMRSARYAGLHLSDQELRIRHFHHTLESYLSGPK
jgi:phenylpropionate dioxygenase-like ring-hydroxylating dioxygenase large terminal subunit